MNKILVINNDFDTMILLKSWLEKKSYQVKFTGNQKDVPVLIEEFEPALIMVDIMQSEVVEQLKNEKESNSIPILLMTGYTLRKGNNKIRDYHDTIEKPFNLSLLEKKIEKLISNRQFQNVM